MQADPPKTKKKKVDKPGLVFLILGLFALAGGVACAVYGVQHPPAIAVEPEFPKVGADSDTDVGSNVDPEADSGVGNKTPTKHYSPLTGLELAAEKRADAPIYCVQTPNGLDGARPQAGLTEAGVIFEAIAEAGITRFAALYQEPDSGVIGPIRSLRTYYLEWDTPFDCTIVHAGGAPDAIAALQYGGYPELDENYDFMYRGTYWQRAWNNLFTTSELLAASNVGATSNPVGFARLTPEEAARARIDTSVEPLVITEPAEGDTSAITISVPAASISFGGWNAYDVNYVYDADSNTYLRSYVSGDPHLVYRCPAGNAAQDDPENFCELVQLSPTVVIAMIVQESRASDNYHESIMALGSGIAYIFQNGSVIKGTWSKPSAADQISFFDDSGAEVKLVPGQTIIEAVPTYGSVSY